MTHSNHTGQHSLLSVDPALHMDQFAACAQTTLTTLIYRLDSTAQLARSRVLKWGCPVSAFGDLGGDTCRDAWTQSKQQGVRRQGWAGA